MFNIFPKNNINEEEPRKFPLYFIVIAIIISIVVFLMLIDNSKSYTANTSIIFVPKSETAAKDSEHIIENMRVLPTKLSFYNKLAEDNYLEDNFSEFSDSKREKLWNKEIKTKRDGNSSILDISVSGNNSEKIKETSGATISTLFNVIGFYYDVRNDVSLRIIQGPLVETSVGNWFWLAILSLIIGTIISFGVNFVSKIISDFILRKKEDLNFEFKRPLFDFKKLEPKKPSKTTFEPVKNKDTGVKSKAEESETKTATPKTATKKSSAPANLPAAPGGLAFIDEDYFRNNIIKGAKTNLEKTPEFEKDIVESSISAKEEKKIEASMEASVEKPDEDVHREPTQEELRKRLNQLLKGEL